MAAHDDNKKAHDDMELFIIEGVIAEAEHSVKARPSEFKAWFEALKNGIPYYNRYHSKNYPTNSEEIPHVVWLSFTLEEGLQLKPSPDDGKYKYASYTCISLVYVYRKATSLHKSSISMLS